MFLLARIFEGMRMITELKSIGDIYMQMPSSDDARRFLENLMWCDGRVCPHCGGVRSTELKGTSHRSGLYQCNECRGQFSITTKTPMHATKLDLRVWLAAIYTVLNSSKGISSVVLTRMIGVSQKCAWKIGHAIREMMREDYGAGSMLAGIVEVDETSVGGAPKFKKGKKNKRGKPTTTAQYTHVATKTIRNTVSPYEMLAKLQDQTVKRSLE